MIPLQQSILEQPGWLRAWADAALVHSENRRTCATNTYPRRIRQSQKNEKAAILTRGKKQALLGKAAFSRVFAASNQVLFLMELSDSWVLSTASLHIADSPQETDDSLPRRANAFKTAKILAILSQMLTCRLRAAPSAII